MGSFRPLRLIIGILLSLFVCPGLGHRHLGRPRAGKIVFWSFIAVFLILAVTLYGVVQDNVLRMKAEGKTLDVLDLDSFLRQIVLDAGGVIVALGVLLAIYFLAPVELALYEIWRAARGLPADPPLPNP